MCVCIKTDIYRVHFSLDIVTSPVHPGTKNRLDNIYKRTSDYSCAFAALNDNRFASGLLSRFVAVRGLTGQ